MVVEDFFLDSFKPLLSLKSLSSNFSQQEVRDFHAVFINLSGSVDLMWILDQRRDTPGAVSVRVFPERLN